MKNNQAKEDSRECMMHYLIFQIKNQNILIFCNYQNLMLVIFLQVREKYVIRIH